MNSTYNCNLCIKGNSSWRAHFQVPFNDLYILVWLYLRHPRRLDLHQNHCLLYFVSVEIEVEHRKPELIGGGISGVFMLKEFHFHWGCSIRKGSEHTINGRQYPMEVCITSIVLYNLNQYLFYLSRQIAYKLVKFLLYTVTDRHKTFSGTHVSCYLLSFEKLGIHTVHFLLTENIKRCTQGILI